MRKGGEEGRREEGRDNLQLVHRLRVSARVTLIGYSLQPKDSVGNQPNTNNMPASFGA